MGDPSWAALPAAVEAAPVAAEHSAERRSPPPPNRCGLRRPCRCTAGARAGFSSNKWEGETTVTVEEGAALAGAGAPAAGRGGSGHAALALPDALGTAAAGQHRVGATTDHCVLRRTAQMRSLGSHVAPSSAGRAAFWEGTFGGFTAAYDCKRLVWFEMHGTMDAAIAREKQIKNWRREWKVVRWSWRAIRRGAIWRRISGSKSLVTKVDPRSARGDERLTRCSPE